MTNLLQLLCEKYPLSERPAGDFSSFSVNGMTFLTKGYDAEGLGNVSSMEAEGFGGAMKMVSLIVNPFNVDAPLFSLDRIQTMGTDTLIMELYDTCLSPERKETLFYVIQEACRDLPDSEKKENWYDDLLYNCSLHKKGSAQDKDRLNAVVNQYWNCYLDLLTSSPACDAVQKKAKADLYSNGLLSHGGPATDTFLNTWGPEKTRAFFRDVLFG